MEPLSKNATEFLTHLKQVANKALTKIPYNLTTMHYTSGKTKFPEQIQWLAPNVQTALRSLRQWTTFECVISIDIGRHVRFYLSTPHKDTPKIRQNLYDRAQKCCAWLAMANAYAPRRCSTSMNVYMFFTDLKKMLPTKNGAAIDTEHANTAFTTSCSAETSIILYREEEWFKVFIHETFHNLGLDFSAQNIHNLQQSLMRHFKIRSEMRIYETYCEVWADMLNILFTQVNWQRALALERSYACNQAAKIFKHFDLTYADLGTTKATSHFNENTEVFCYFVLRSLWMWNLNRFLQWCLTHNNGSLLFSGSPAQFARHMILDIPVDKKYLEVVQPKSDTQSRSLRMTMYG
jgi:hypothetical protein